MQKGQRQPVDRQTKPPLLPGGIARVLSIGAGLVVFLVIFTALIHSALRDNVLGADFYTFWLAGRAMLVEHENPYGQEVTLQKQIAVYGRPALPEEDQVAFAYPPYSLLILIPFLGMSFDWAYASWLALNIVGFLSLLFILFQPASRPLSLTAILFYPIFFCLIVGNFNLLVASVVLLFFGQIAWQKNTSAGIQALTALSLAWATAKPQTIWFFTIFIVLFALKRRLHLFLKTFFAGLLVMLAISFAYVPGWIGEWTHRIQEYAAYVRSQPVLSELLGSFLPEQAALVVTGIVFLACLALTGWFYYRWWKGQLGWMKVLAWTGLVTYLFHLHGMAYEHTVFLAPLMLWAGMQERWNARPVLLAWSVSLVASWLAFAGGVALPSVPLSLAADRSPVLINTVWVAWLLLSNRELTSAPGSRPGNLTTRTASRDRFQV